MRNVIDAGSGEELGAARALRIALTACVTCAARVMRWHRLGAGTRVRQWNRALVASPSSQPRIAANSTSQTSDTCELPNTQLTFTCAVFEAASAIRNATRATATIA